MLPETENSRPVGGDKPPSRAPRWQVLYLRPRLEKRTADLCRGQGIPVYLPLRRKVAVHQRRKVMTELPVFPGYLFVELDAARKLTLQKSNHVLRFLEPAKPYAMLRQLAQIRRALRADPSLQSVKPLTVGRRVRVVSGPFMGVEGVVSRLASTMRVVLTVDLIGQAIAVEARREQVEPDD